MVEGQWSIIPMPSAISHQDRRIKPAFALAGAAGCIALWVVLAFVMAIPSGWVHVPFALGICLIAVAIIESRPADG